MSRAWSKAARKACEQAELEDSSSICPLWHDIKETGMAQMKSQDNLVVICVEIAAALEGQIVEVKKQKTLLHDRWTKQLADVKKKQIAHDKARDVYAESVKAAETSIMNRDAAHEQKMPDKAIQKAEAKAKASLKDVETMHAAYQKAVTTYAESQAAQDATCIDLLQQFEKLERARMRVFVDQMDKFAGQHDALRAQLDSVAASLHTYVNAVNIDADMQEFIKTNTTGKVAEPHVKYIPCKSQILDHALGISPSNAGNIPTAVFTAAPVSSAPAAQPSSPPSAPPAAPSMAAASAPPAAAPVSSTPTNAATAAAVVAAPPAPVIAVASAGGESATALYDFDQNEPDDLPFKAGQQIRLLACGDQDDWWQGEMGGRVGIFPKAYVSKNPSSGASAGGAPGGAPVASAAAEGQVAAAPAFLSTSTSSQVAPAPAPAATPQASTANPFGDDDANFGGGGGGSAPTSTQASGAAPGVEGVPAAAPGGADGAVAAEVPKLLDAQCAALFDFDGQDDDELSFKAGDILIITGELNGWFLGRCRDGGEKVGIFPSNFVQMNK